MSCLEKQHTSHRLGSMLHHRFPNGFTDLFMDETDREVSTLTDRAFRSLCVGDDAVYNDDFLYGYSPYSCLKPLAGEPLKKKYPKESKKEEPHKPDKGVSQSWKQQQQSISHMSSFLKVFSAAEESCEGMIIRNGDMTDSNGESWDKSALRSIEKELSEFSSNCHTSLQNRHHKNQLPHQSGNGSTNKNSKDVNLSSGKFTRIKHGKSTVKLRKLNIKNFFLHSELSPFQTWTDCNRFPFAQENTVGNILSTDNISKWYDLPFYKKLTEAHRKETLHSEEAQTCQKQQVDPSDTNVSKPNPAPPVVLPKPSAPLAEKRCSSDGGDAHAAPWRRNKSRAKSTVPANQVGIPPQESNSKTTNESILLPKKEIKSVEVKAVEDDSPLASTPFSICQLMTPVIPSRQPTETSEVLQAVLSPSVCDLLGRPHSEVKGTPEPPVKRESYKSLASSILFNLKDNRKRVKSRYSPPKFITSEVPDGGPQSPQTDCVNQAASEDTPSGLNTPDILKDALAVFSPPLEPLVSSNVDLTKHDKTLSDDYLLSNLLQNKQDSVGNNHGEEYPNSPFIPLKKNKSPMAKKQNYPSLNLYKKASPADTDVKYLQVPLSISTPANVPPAETKDGELPKNTGLSPKTLNVVKDFSPMISPCSDENVGLSPGWKQLPNVPDKTKRMVKNTREKYSCLQPTSEENNPGGQTSMMNVIRAARDAINSARNKAQSASYPDNIKWQISHTEEIKQKDTEQRVSKETFGCIGQSPETANDVLSQNTATGELLIGKSSHSNREPPPVPKRNFAKSSIRHSLDKQTRCKVDKASSGDLRDDKVNFSPKQNEPVSKQDKQKHAFSARQNNYIKHQRYAVTDDEQTKEYKKNRTKTRTGKETDNETTSLEEMRESEHIFNDLQAAKVLDRVRLGDRMLEFARTKLEVLKTDEETKVENELISRELRNIKKGMLSLRGNTSAKKKIFAQKEKEAFTNVDSHVIANKALDNYDRAKMALEEVISERERKKTEEGSVLTSEEKDRSSETRVQEGTKDCITELREGQERLGDFRNQNQLRQTQPGETQKSGGRADLPDRNTVSNEQNATQNSEFYFEGHSRSTEEGRKYSMNECVDKTLGTPLVPPRNKKGGNKRDGSITEEKNTDGEIVKSKGEIIENPAEQYVQTRTSSEIKDAPPTQYETLLYKERQDNVNNANLKLNTATDSKTCGSALLLNDSLSENAACLSTKLRENESKGDSSQIIMCPNEGDDSQKTSKKKQKSPLKPDHLIRPDENTTKSPKQETQTDKINNEDADTEAFCEIPRNIVSPLLLLNGISMAQSPPDQGSLSSKSSYFSVESALPRNTETESNVYHSLENLALEVEKANGPGQTVLQKEMDKVLVEYYSLNDCEKGLEEKMLQMKTPRKKPEDADRNNTETVTTNEQKTHDENDPTVSPTTTFSPTSEIPALFKIKDNTFSNRTKKPVVPWSPRGSLNTSEMIEKKSHPTKENPEFSLVNETCAINTAVTPSELLNTGENLSPLLSLLSSKENPKKAQVGVFLTVPQEDDTSSRVTPSSEGMESITTSTADTADKAGMNAGVLVESESTKAPSKPSESICSGSDNQTELPKPPVILPKSEKAVLKAIKLTNRRMKKEEAQRLSQKSSQTSSKHTADRPKSDKLEQKTNSSAKTGRKSDKKHIEKNKDSTPHHEIHLSHDNTQSEPPQSYNKNHHHKQATMSHTTQRQSHDSVDCINQNRDMPPERTLERQGRSSNRRVQEKTKQRHYSNDRIVGTAPVYKDPADERPTSDRSFHRSQSIDRYMVGKAELSAHVSTNEKLEPRAQRIEKSIMHELQQRGRARNKESQGNPLRRSHSIDAYPTEAPLLSRQLSNSSQLSRQSSIEHTIVTQSFPMTQRKLLQDPDSGQYFFVDLPVQVKTKTFFDPDTGSYVQLPLQTPDGALPHASHMEVLTPPMVVYHSFVPVPLSPMARNATIQTPQIELNDLEQKHLERVRQKHCKEGHPYLEPAYSQQDHLLGEFMSTEELDCPS
ncbi:uncharacterized protein LOC106526095 [Austrofundulus limnaeus]|uniref:Uncharacterized protein LOC106526095 n=1 Tax=Austrofundulus limnaeus TaxID=52670 RepID=A0A2I4C7R9_AUSLI|nr:PREDICTED: uncharacterized protein LOC106526095 [Austrofundulus limnaeus]XP_013876035.1 PREDICTED: uncharacterized protein LOC106526095 [Austrofundulus limnaeus]XP_013876036.1 PREDICTED: uncharacterized protein LOC106526095 [Austrofundulus limnaeus]